MRFWLITAALMVALAVQIVIVSQQSRSTAGNPASGDVIGTKRAKQSPSESKLDKPTAGGQVLSKTDATKIVADFLDNVRQVNDYAASRPNSAEIARGIKAGEIVLRDEVLKISRMRTVYAREEAATALMNAFLMLSKTEAMRGLIPADRELSSLLATDCPEERGVWALIAGFSADSALRFQVIQMALGDSDEFAKSGALWACSTGMADLKEAQEAVLRASRDSGQRHQVVAVVGLETIRAEGAIAALLDAAGDRDPNVRATAEGALARRAAWDDKAMLSLGTLLQGQVSGESAKRIWKALSSANALSRLSAGDREVLERLCKENR